MKIAVDARPSLWPTTGIGTIVRNVISRIGKVDGINEYSFYFDQDPVTVAAALAPAQSYFHPQANELLWANSYMRRELEAQKFDIYVSFLEKDIPLVSGHTKIVCMVHDLIPFHFPESAFRGALHRWYYSGLIRAATRRADIVLTNSEYSKQQIVKHLGIPENKICKLTLGVDTCDKCLSGGGTKIIERLGLGGEYAVALGSTEPRKNNAKVIRAFNDLPGRFSAAKLVVVGRPWRGRQFDSSLLNERVMLPGFVSDTDLRTLLKHARMLLFPSLEEGFGLPVLEAMELGTPVVTSSVSALPEVGGDAVLYVDPLDQNQIRDRMQLLLENEQLRTDLSRKGRERAKQFRWEKTCEELAELFAKLCQ